MDSVVFLHKFIPKVHWWSLDLILSEMMMILFVSFPYEGFDQ